MFTDKETYFPPRGTALGVHTFKLCKPDLPESPGIQGRGKTLLPPPGEGREAVGRSKITLYVKDHKDLHQNRDFRAGLMALCPKEKGKVVAEQPESLQENQALVTPTQTAVLSQGHCTCKQPSLALVPACLCCSAVDTHSLTPAAEGKDEGQSSPVEAAHGVSCSAEGARAAGLVS